MIFRKTGLHPQIKSEGRLFPDHALEPRLIPRSDLLDMAGEREADMAREKQRAGRCAIVQHAAAGDSCFLDIRVLREIPVRIIDLQQVVKDVTNKLGAIAADVQVENKMSR